MALLVTQLVEEISAEGQTPLLRVTQLVEEISAEGQTPNLRVTQLVLEVSEEINSYHVADSLNNWSDNVASTLGETEFPLTSASSDDLNSWGDDVSLLEIVILTETVSDNLDAFADTLETLLAVHLWAGGDGSWPIWRDDVSSFISGFIGLELASDLNSWLDATSSETQFAPSFFDTLSLSDSLTLNTNIPKEFSDALNNWLDYFEYRSDFTLRFIDLFRLSDKVSVAFTQGRSAADTLSISDYLALLYSTIHSLNDTLVLDDLVSIYLAVESGVSVADSLNNWQDNASVYGSDETDDYYRRYLNDRTFMNGDQFQSPIDWLEMEDVVVVELV